ncbi:hypothetical protein OGH69_03390 [Flavobacterium sp. MFBS3-15]|uniref:hypothetical protein n=1 Tax=Flavobacterium sp. MFBS3-15 TaxID=2989816 RepID=UPI0022361A33|nr:hypothetical protein [Flavobacterium sp. MFBS3-15]MCW4467998.1 hypothetical protein [Flavobacterium sp. MFBS3-15]
MKYPFLYSIPVLALLLSCSVEENVSQEDLIRENINAYSEAIPKYWENLNIDFSKLFDYNSRQNASDETKRAFGFITKDLQEELAKKADSDHAYINFALHEGKALIGSVQFGNEVEGIFTEYITLNSNVIRPYVYFTHNHELYNQNKDFNKKYYREIVMSTSENNLSLEEFIKAKLEKPGSSADFKVYVDASSSKLYGFVE